MASVFLCLFLSAGEPLLPPVVPVVPPPPVAIEPRTPVAGGPQGTKPSAPAAPRTGNENPPAPSRPAGAAPTPAPAGEGTHRDDLPVPVLPPALSTHALCEEIRLSAQDQRSAQAKLAEERARLEKLAAEIAQARAALRKETARLEALAKHPPAPRPATAAGETPAPGEKSPMETLARTVRGMRPEQAAAVLSHLDRGLAVDILRHIRPADAGAILEKLKPESAAALVASMAGHDGSRGAP